MTSAVFVSDDLVILNMVVIWLLWRKRNSIHDMEEIDLIVRVLECHCTAFAILAMFYFMISSFQPLGLRYLSLNISCVLHSSLQTAWPSIFPMFVGNQVIVFVIRTVGRRAAAVRVICVTVYMYLLSQNWPWHEQWFKVNVLISTATKWPMPEIKDWSMVAGNQWMLTLKIPLQHFWTLERVLPQGQSSKVFTIFK